MQVIFTRVHAAAHVYKGSVAHGQNGYSCSFSWIYSFQAAMCRRGEHAGHQLSSAHTGPSSRPEPTQANTLKIIKSGVGGGINAKD